MLGKPQFYERIAELEEILASTESNTMLKWEKTPVGITATGESEEVFEIAPDINRRYRLITLLEIPSTFHSTPMEAIERANELEQMRVEEIKRRARIRQARDEAERLHREQLDSMTVYLHGFVDALNSPCGERAAPQY